MARKLHMARASCLVITCSFLFYLCWIRIGFTRELDIDGSITEGEEWEAQGEGSGAKRLTRPIASMLQPRVPFPVRQRGGTIGWPLHNSA